MKPYVLMIFCTSALLALPSGGQVVKGDAAITHVADALQVQASGKAIIHWDRFDIATQETVSFTQSQTQSAVLNRVMGGTQSQINGLLQSNCPIYLINPQGVFIGTAAQIHTAGFLASTADISNEAFWQGSELRFENLGEGGIVNLGSIHSSQGDVIFIARLVDNPGKISAPQGVIDFATGEVVINPHTKQMVFIRLKGSPDEMGIDNSGSLQALAIEFKTQSPYEKAICHTGAMEALTVKEQNGRIHLVADQGHCFMDAPLTAKEGKVVISANAVHVTEKSVIDVSSNLDAHGGSITVLAEEQLIFQGLAKVGGGSAGGDGGTLHLSCKGSSFEVGNHSIDALAPQGKTGRMIFDPKFIAISSDGSDPATGNTFAFNPAGSVGISGATLQSALDAANVTLQANTDIILTDEVTASTAGHGLTLQAGRSIFLFNNVTLNGGDFIATINDSGASAGDRDAGVAKFQMGNSSQISTQGGNFTVDVGTFGGVQEGEVAMYSGTIDAGGGNIAMTGFARQDGSSFVYGIYLAGPSMIQTQGTGTLSLNGTGGNGSNVNPGISLSSDSGQIQTEAGLLHLVGNGGGDGTGSGHTGIYSAAYVGSTTTGPIIFEGFAGNGIDINMGICLSGGEVNTLDGNITLNGTGSGTGGLNFGLRLDSNAQVISTGAGLLTLSGTTSNGQSDNHGVSLSGGSLTANTGALSVTGTGQGAENNNYGIRIETSSQCISTGTAPITLQGNNTAGLSGNAGVSISTSGGAITSGYGNIQVTGISAGTTDFNQGVCVEMGQISSTGTGAGAAQIYLLGTGGPGTDYCNGVIVQGTESMVTAVDGNITIEGTAGGSGQNNDPIIIDPPFQVSASGSGTITYIPH